MPRPPTDPRYYSASTAWWPCPVCPKSCKSKAGRLRHIRAKHGTMALLNQSEPAADLEDIVTQTPIQSPQGSPPPSSVQFEDIETRDPFDMNFATSPASSTFLCESLE
jgi:hypothetical protein